MKNTLFYILSMGLAFYSGLKIPRKPVVKTVVKEVVKKDTISILMKNTCEIELKQCITKHDKLVEEANDKVKNLESQIDACEERYFEEKPVSYPEKNLKPETVREKEPEMGDIYDY